MNLAVSYLGLSLPHPVMVGASPLSWDLDRVKRLEDAGASAIVMPSLFEEQITRETTGTIMDMELHAESFAEALSYFPAPEDFKLGPDHYLEHIRRMKEAVKIPVIASLNGTTPMGWIDYARKLQQAGADALELNVYYLATNPLETGEMVERRTLEIIRMVKNTVTIPVAVKLSPYFSSMAHFAKVVEGAGADALVLFNRFYQPDLDLENLDVVPSLELSGPSTLRLRVRWLAILFSHVRVPLAASGGIHGPEDALKAVMAGASAVQMVSALLQRGPAALTAVRDGMARWLEEHEYESLEQARGSLSLLRCPSPAAFERANYMRVLQGWKF